MIKDCSDMTPIFRLKVLTAIPLFLAPKVVLDAKVDSTGAAMTTISAPSTAVVTVPGGLPASCKTKDLVMN